MNRTRKSRLHLREKRRGICNHRTPWRASPDVVKEAHQVLRGWTGRFHHGNRVRVIIRPRNYSRNRFRRWLGRKHACRHNLWEDYPNEQLHTSYGLFELPISAKWKAAR